MLTLKSPAKINLFLKIVARRNDGFHELASLFQAIDLHDILTFRLSNVDRLKCNCLSIPTDSSNLILKAVDLFRRKTKRSFGLHVDLHKRIPIEAGLGGGSSNAATTLWALNRLLDCRATDKELMTWASEIGSDLSFFFSTGTAYCTGRGENVRSLAPLPPKSLWICKPENGLSTPQVYSQLCLSNLHPHDPLEALDGFISGKPNYFNDLEKPALSLLPELQTFKQDLLDQGFKTVMLSGSGSSFICLDGEPKEHLGSFACKSSYLNRSLDNWY